MQPFIGVRHMCCLCQFKSETFEPQKGEAVAVETTKLFQTCDTSSPWGVNMHSSKSRDHTLRLATCRQLLGWNNSVPWQCHDGKGYPALVEHPSTLQGSTPNHGTPWVRSGHWEPWVTTGCFASAPKCKCFLCITLGCARHTDASIYTAAH